MLEQIHKTFIQKTEQLAHTKKKKKKILFRNTVNKRLGYYN